MAETASHKQAKGKADGVNEKAIPGNRRIDSLSKTKATEIERSGNPKLLEKAARRLNAVTRPQKVLIVPNPDIAKALQAMKNVKARGTVRNISGTKRRSV